MKELEGHNNTSEFLFLFAVLMIGGRICPHFVKYHIYTKDETLNIKLVVLMQIKCI